jgi:hypothetical protein
LTAASVRFSLNLISQGSCLRTAAVFLTLSGGKSGPSAAIRDFRDSAARFIPTIIFVSF